MRISAIQPKVYHNQMKSKVTQPKLREDAPKPQENNATAFKGMNGAVTGLGVGLIGGLLVFAGGAIAGVVALPAAIGGLAVGACGLGGAYAGDKIGDKIG